jgi:chemotaxis response regulator CheB
MWHKAVVIGVSAGGFEALKILLPALPADFPLPMAIAQHRSEPSNGFMAAYLNQMSRIAVSEAEDKEPLCAGHAYLALAGYHLLIESGFSFSLSVDPRVNHCCPSIDVLFESAADVFAESLIGIVRTGANADGAQGLKGSKLAADWPLCRIQERQRQSSCRVRRLKQRQWITLSIWSGSRRCSCGSAPDGRKSMAQLAKHHAPKVTLAAMAVRPNILIVDDRKENLLATEKILRHLDAGIFQANSGNEALSLVLRHKFAIILLDVQMPEMDGFETAMLMQEHESMRGVPIIFVTAISKEERYATQAAEIGAVDYIFKPINPEILKSKVQVYLDLYVQREHILKLNTSLQQSNEELERFAYNRGLLEAAPDAMVVVSRAEKSS